MKDLITYCPNKRKLMPEVVKSLPAYVVHDENLNPAGFQITKTLTRSENPANPLESVSIVRCTADEEKQLAALKNITVLLSKPAGQLTPASLSKLSASGRVKYDRCYDQSPRDILDEKGNIIGTEIVSALCGGFA